jgi:hypothetical protein
MRIVAARAGDRRVDGSADGAATDDAVAELDLRRRRPGRGAWLHPSPDCLDLALRRRALPRALRVTGPLDTSGLAAAWSRAGQHSGPELDIEQGTQVTEPAPPEPRHRSEPEAGHSADEHPMSTQQ